MLENILNRWKFILDQFEEEPKKLLAKELCKITPLMPNFEVDWRMNDDYYEPEDVYIFHYTVKICPIFQAKDLETVDLFDYFSKLFSNSSTEDLKKIDKSLQSMSQKMDLPYRLENSPMPCLELMPEIGVLMFKIEGKCPKKTTQT